MVYIRIACWRFRCRRLAGGPNSWWVVAHAFMHRERVVAMLLVHVFEAVPNQKDIGGAIRHVNAHRSLAQVAVLDQNDLITIFVLLVPLFRRKIAPTWSGPERLPR